VLVSKSRLSSDASPVYFLCLVAHHIVADGWSMSLALEELAALYDRRVSGRGRALERLAVDYYDVAAWQASAVARGAFDADLQYWVDELEGAPPRLLLHYDFLPPAKRSWRGEKMAFGISQDLTERVKALSARAHTTDFMTLLAAFEVLLHKMS